MLISVVAPGSAQLLAGNRRLGRFVLRLWLAAWFAVALAVIAALWSESFALWFVSNPTALGLARWALIIVAIVWVALLVDAWRLSDPLSLPAQHRRTISGVNGLVCLLLAGMLLSASHLVGVQRDFLVATFAATEVRGAYEGRFNILLLGGDSGADRWGMRPDSITLASIDAATGRTVLIGLPRNLARVPFAEGSVMARAFPRGFDCEGCYLNGVSTWAEDHQQLFADAQGEVGRPGVEATVSAVEGVTGLTVSYWAMVNLAGFADLVDAVGGVRLRIRQPIPVGGLGKDVTGYLKPGDRVLDGNDTLWFARAREGSDDYSRMARQKCVMHAIVTQVSARDALRNFERLAAASSRMVSTNLPAGELDRFLALALRAREQKISTLGLVPPAIDTTNPDYRKIHDKVAAAVG
ncbi:MAG: LCP family protein, partial [Nocardioides sp.]